MGISSIGPKTKKEIILTACGKYKILACSIKDEGNRMFSTGYIKNFWIKKININKKNVNKNIILNFLLLIFF